MSKRTIVSQYGRCHQPNMSIVESVRMSSVWVGGATTITPPYQCRSITSSATIGCTTSRVLQFGVSSSSHSLWDPHPSFAVRWRRKDGARFQHEIRKITKKQRRKYNLRQKRIREEREKHNPPGSQAGPRREFMEREKQELLHYGEDKEEVMDMLNDPSYGEADALLDDLMGNSTEFLPTPEPHYLGHQHKKFFNRVADQMDDYRRYQQQLLEARSLQAGRTDIMLPEPVELPTDKDVSFALRAFRDKNGTRQRPVGIVAALQHVLSDMGVPLSCLGEYSYTTLMMCARTPTEARRILQMMRENRVPPSAYAWTILCDVYAKTGDYQGCIAVQEEMLKTDGIAPTMASYTSLIAACYKVCMDGRIAHSIRAKAAEVAFEKWMEMRIVGACSNEGMTEEGVYSEGREHPDTMAYGAMLRIFAAQGQPERALSLLGEMQRFQIKPTTLCFTSALRAVARSHAVAVRYERGSSPRHRRREEITYHHGKLAREILIMAEGTGADHDQGFVAALCLCAAEAGDVATAKAIYLASQIRRLDQFRTVGPNSHLARLRGENVPVDYDSTNTEHVSDRQPAMLTSKNLAGENSSDIMEGDFAQEKMTTEDGKLVDLASGIYNRQQRAKYPSFGEREYGKDNRALTAILHACAKAADQNGMGTIWQGRENKGYLCINSLRLIKAIKLPRYRDKSIPGQTITDTMTWAGEQRDLDGYRPGKRRSRKFEGIDFVDDAAGTIDDLDDTFSKIFLDKDGRRKPEYRNATPDDIWRLKYGDDDDPRKPDNATANAQTAVAEKPPTNTDDDGIDSDEDAYFDALADELLGLDPSIPRPPRQEIIPKETYEDDEKFAQSTEEMYYDLESMSWKTRPKIPKTKDMTAHEIREEKEEKLFFHYDPKAAEVHDIESEEKFLELSEAAANDESGPESDDDSAEELYYDKDEMRWKTRTKAEAKAAANAAKMTRYEAKMYAKFTQKQQEVEDANLHQEPQAVDEACAPEPELEKEPDQLVQSQGEDASALDKKAFSQFYSDLQKELSENNEDPVNEQEARELFEMMKEEYNEVMSMSPENIENILRSDGQSTIQLSDDNKVVNEIQPSSDEPRYDARFPGDKKASTTAENEDLSGGGIQSTEGRKAESTYAEVIDKRPAEWEKKSSSYNTGAQLHEGLMSAGSPMKESIQLIRTARENKVSHQTTATTTTTTITYDEQYDEKAFFEEKDKVDIDAVSEPSIEDTFKNTVEVVEDSKVSKTNSDLDELRSLLPTFSERRLKKILRAFRESLSDPSLLDLIPAVRENMPDYITNTWLKKMSTLTAKFALHKAAEDGVINIHLLNATLELETSLGSIDRALEFHETEFKRHRMQPTEYSDRLVIQMLLKNNRFSRALAFKNKVKESGRVVDLKSYGSLIDYCCRREQLGSGLLLLKECLSVHHAAPEESCLRKLRLLCRQQKITDEVGLTEMIGEDPLEWLRHGEAELKREMSKKGRRNVQRFLNAF